MQSNHYALYKKSELWPFTKLFNEWQKPLLSVYLVNCFLDRHENFCIGRAILADYPERLYSVFNDPGESYCPRHFIFFT
jgi:hypothetical protein